MSARDGSTLWNGPMRELVEVDSFGDLKAGSSIDEEKVYCTVCGTIFIRANGRECPACVLHDEIEKLREIVEEGDR